MQRTKIEYLTHVWNPIHGCGRGCNYCWATRMARRLAAMGMRGYDAADPMKPTVHWERLGEPDRLVKPARIGVGFMGDLFDPQFGDSDIQTVIDTCANAPRHQSLFLTKQPARLRDFNPWPSNCWVGVTATNDHTFVEALRQLKKVKAAVRYISVEPMLGPVYWWPMNQAISWVIIGGQTRPNRPPETLWVRDLANRCALAAIPLFMKRNCGYEPLVQQFPAAGRSEVSRR